MSSSQPDKEEATKMPWFIRPARTEDIAALEDLIVLSVQTLQAAYYSPAQRAAALGPVFGVDRQLIRDGTYFVAEAGAQIVGCGGWSRRDSHYGGDSARASEDALLNPVRDPARIRAFFVHPDWARRGIGSAILLRCEEAIIAAGFGRAIMVATLAGVPLYAKFGYLEEERFDITMRGGLTLPAVRMGKTMG
jgi:GNAT superfamily N-acetyltransferase